VVGATCRETRRVQGCRCAGRKSGRRTRRTPLLETFAAVHRPALRRLEGDSGFFSALRTGCLSFAARSAGTVARIVRAFALARLAPLGFVPKALIGVKRLLARGKNEFGAAVRALQKPILILHPLLQDPALVAGRAATRHQPDSIEDLPPASAGPLPGRPEAARQFSRGNLT